MVSRLLPFFAALIVLGLFFALVLTGLSHNLDQHLAARQQDLPLSEFTPQIIRTVIAFHQRPHTPHFGRPLARSFTQTPTLNAYLRRIVYTCLLILNSNLDASLAAYLNRIPLGKPEHRSIGGFPQGARVYFGVPHTRLRIGETLLLCDRALHPVEVLPSIHPDQALEKRNRLLQHMYNAGHLAPSEYRLEINQPLSLAADHRPIF
ncbi:MAG: transglycosylase domain-containing protein [bacterium]|nr:transglycosylase domain-containing protein [bacterium]